MKPSRFSRHSSSRASSLWNKELIVKDITAGTLGAVIVFPTILNCASVITQPMGPQYAIRGIAAAFAASILVSLMRGLFSRSPLHLVSPKASYAVIVAALLFQIMAMPEFKQSFPTPETAAPMLFAISFLCTFLVGVFQLILGLAHLGMFIKFVPYPVIAGFINGFAVQLIAIQIPPMLGEKNWGALFRLVTTADLHFSLGSALLGLLACVVTAIAPYIQRRIPPALCGLVIGGGLYHSLEEILPSLAVGQVIGPVSLGLPIHLHIDTIFNLMMSPAFKALLPNLVATAITMSLIASLQSLLSMSGADSLLGTRHNGNRELVEQGAGNVLAGLFGGMPTGGSPSVTRTVLTNGGRSKLANLAHATVLIGMVIGLGNVIGMIPLSVMSGVVVASTFNQMDEWSRRLLHQLLKQKNPQRRVDLWANLAIIVVVALLVIIFSVLPALIAGMTLAFAAFIRQASRSVIRRTVSGNNLRSRTTRSLTERAMLNTQMKKVAIVEIQGAVFFGSADQIASHLEEVAKDYNIIILDMKRVSDIDSSGVIIFDRLDQTLAKSKCTLYISYVTPGGHIMQMFQDMGFGIASEKGRIFEDTDTALATAEDLFLKETKDSKHGEMEFSKSFFWQIEAGIAEKPKQKEGEIEYTPSNFDIFRNFSNEDFELVRALLERQKFDEGMRIVQEGNPGDAIYLVAAGQVSIVRRVGERSIRYAVLRPGISFGEISILTKRPVMANVVADANTVCYRLSEQNFQFICKNYPILGQKILFNIAFGLTDMVSSLSDIVRELEQ
jgi:MFS superfamily sulfate permease-like transporter